MKCLPALRHEYRSVKYRGSVTFDRLLSDHRLQEPQYIRASTCTPAFLGTSHPADEYHYVVAKCRETCTQWHDVMYQKNGYLILCVFILLSPANCLCLPFCPLFILLAVTEWPYIFLTWFFCFFFWFFHISPTLWALDDVTASMAFRYCTEQRNLKYVFCLFT